METLPIWYPAIVDLSGQLASGSVYVEYKIYHVVSSSSTLIYTGRAYARDGECWTRINDICAGYLKNEFTGISVTGSAAGNASDLVHTFKVNVGTTEIETYKFYYCWDDLSPASPDSWDCLSHPIRKEIERRMMVTATFLQNGTKTISVDSTSYTFTASNPINARIGYSALASASKVTINDEDYDVVDSRQRYALYYVNLYGGWDWFLPRGAETWSENYDRKTIVSGLDSPDGESITAGRKKTYSIGVTRSLVLRSGKMTDAESKMMRHLISSPLVVVYDMESGYWYYATIADTTCERKSYRNQGRKNAEYTITLNVDCWLENTQNMQFGL